MLAQGAHGAQGAHMLKKVQSYNADKRKCCISYVL